LIIGAWFILDRTAGSSLLQAVRDADRLDPHWTLSKLESRRLKPKDEENAALRVRRVYAEIPSNWLMTPGPSPFRGSELYQLMASSELPFQLEEGPSTGLRNEVEELAPAIAEARPLAGLGWGRYEIKWEFNPASMLLPHIQEARQVAQLLRFDALARAQDGDIDGALESCRAIIGVARSFGDEPILVSQLARNAIDDVALDTVQRALAWGQASDAAMARMQARLAEEAAEPALIHTLRGERAIMDEFFDKVATGQISIANSLRGGPGIAAQRSMLEGLAGPYIRHNQGIVLDYMNKAVELAKRPSDRHSAALARLEARLRPQGTIAQLMIALSRTTMIATGRLFEQERRRLATLEACRTLLAAERFRLARGRWPRSVAEIPKEFLPNPQPDPYDGRPINLVRREDGLTIYAIGTDGKDHGGQVDTKRSPRPPRGQMQNLDWGFRLWDVPKRGQPPPPPDLPEDVFANGQSPEPEN
jgi:hypothetical protein